MAEDWLIDIRDQCVVAKVSFFFKQWGGTNKSKTGRLLQGRIWDELPMATKSRQLPLRLKQAA